MGAGALVAGLSGCAAPASNGTANAANSEPQKGSLPSFFTAPEPITEFTETKEYDVVIVGAGTAGVPAALSAKKNGASVAVLQKESQPISQGNTNTAIRIDEADPAGAQKVVSMLLEENQFRSDRKLIEVWINRSQEALEYCLERSQEGPYPASITTEKNIGTDEQPVPYFSTKYGQKPISTAEGIIGLAEVAEKDGVEFFYKTPGVQLVKDDSGRVTGVVGETGNGTYTLFNAKKGVILATGDYQNDEEMVAYYCPDILNFDRKQMNKTGDGHKMGLWAGAQIEPIPHTKMIHDFDSGPMFEEPFLWVDENGERFCNETVGLSLVCNFLRSEPAGWYSQIFDSSYETQVAEWGSKPTAVADLEVYMPEVEMDERPGVREDLIATYRADTLDELADKLGIPADALKKSVERYNEIVELGKDEDFGKDEKYLQPITTPPFYGIHKHVRVSALCSGLIINDKTEVLDGEGNPIPGLYAAGNCSGPFYGGVDYPLPIPGLSIGRCFTFGYVAGETAANA